MNSFYTTFSQLFHFLHNFFTTNSAQLRNLFAENIKSRINLWHLERLQLHTYFLIKILVSLDNCNKMKKIILLPKVTNIAFK